MSVFGGVGSRIAELAQQVISNNAKFESLERSTTTTLGDFRTLMLHFEDRLRQMESVHVREVAALRAEIKVLDGRLSTLSEQALHAVAEKTIRDLGRGDRSGLEDDPVTIAQVGRVPVESGTADPS